jgi:hypothetical protein
VYRCGGNFIERAFEYKRYLVFSNIVVMCFGDLSGSYVFVYIATPVWAGYWLCNFCVYYNGCFTYSSENPEGVFKNGFGLIVLNISIDGCVYAIGVVSD